MSNYSHNLTKNNEQFPKGLSPENSCCRQIEDWKPEEKLNKKNYRKLIALVKGNRLFCCLSQKKFDFPGLSSKEKARKVIGVTNQAYAG